MQDLCCELATRLRKSIGKVGKESAAARFAAATAVNGFSVEDQKPYAEVCPLTYDYYSG